MGEAVAWAVMLKVEDTVLDRTARPQSLACIETKAGRIEGVLKPRHIKSPPEGSQFNYITDIKAKWIGMTCYFISIYACPGPNAIAPTFEEKFARMEYVGDAKFALSFMRPIGKWVELFTGISVDECVQAIQDDPWFIP